MNTTQLVFTKFNKNGFCFSKRSMLFCLSIKNKLNFNDDIISESTIVQMILKLVSVVIYINLLYI